MGTLSEQHKNREVDDEIRKNHPEFMKFVNKKADPVKKPPILSYTTKAPPKASDKEPSTENSEPSPDDKEPSSDDKEPTTDDEEPNTDEERRRRRRQADIDDKSENKEEEVEEDYPSEP